MRLPGHLLPEAFVESDARLPAEVTLQLAGVGERVALVAVAGRSRSESNKIVIRSAPLGPRGGGSGT